MMTIFGMLIGAACVLIAFGIYFENGAPRLRRWVYAVLHLFHAFVKVKCAAPRMSPGSARLTPEVVREALDFKCELWKFHNGDHEAEVEEPGGRKRAARWSDS